MVTASTPEPVSSGPNFGRRRAMVAGGAVALVGAAALLIGGLGGGGTETLSISLPSTSTTTTTLPPTTTTTTTTTTLPATTSTTTLAPTTTTTTMVPVPTTILDGDGVPIWEPYEPLPPLDGIAALTGQPAEADITARPIIAAKMDNTPSARPQWGLDEADAIIEENVEGVTRFVALFQTRLPDRIGPVRSARTGDLDIVTSMNRPILAWSGGNRGVTNWVESAARSGILVDFSAQKNPCYNRNSSRKAPHNLQVDPICVLGNAPTAGPARSLWAFDAAWVAPDTIGAVAQDSFRVEMDGVTVDWVWNAGFGWYVRSQNGSAHLAASGNQIAVNNVVEIAVVHAPSPVDARSPNPITVGSGAAVVHRDGISIPATWIRTTPYDPFTFVDNVTQQPIPLDVGTTLVELVRDR